MAALSIFKEDIAKARRAFTLGPAVELVKKAARLPGNIGCADGADNPFSMPQGELSAFDAEDPLTIKAFQYDCVCNGQELSSGAIRNHKPEVMAKAFGLVGYDLSIVEEKFGALYKAFQYGAPPHGGCAFGIDRIVMLLTGEDNLREVNAFVMNGAYEDLLMGAPAEASAEQLKDLGLKIALGKDKAKDKVKAA